MPDKNIALKIALLTADITQRALALAVRMDETRLSRIISGEVEPTRDERRAIAKALNQKIGDLFPRQKTGAAA